MSKQEGKLQSDALGLLSTAALTAAYMAPALSIYTLLGTMVLQVGVAVGFVMFLGLVMTLPSAISFGMLTREMPTAGGVYAWSRRALGPSMGLWVGLSTATYYVLTVIFPPIVFGQFFNEVLKLVGLHESVWTWLLGAVLSLVVAGYVTYRGIVISSETAFAMLITELTVVVALAATFIGAAILNGTFTWAPIKPSAASGGWSGIYLALPLALLAMVCDAVTPTSEETKDAARTIPLAMVMTCILIGTWYVVGFSAFAMATTPGELTSLSEQKFATPITPLAERFWGPLKFLVTITGMTASIGALVPCSTAASRVLYAMGRDGTLPGWLSYIHPKTKAPWHALHVVFGATAIAVIPVVIKMGAPRTVGWWSNVFGWFIAIVYIFANLSNFVYYWRFRRERFHVIWNLFVPLIGLAAQCLVVWRVVIVELWNQGWFGRSSQVFIVIVATVSAVYVHHARRCRPGPEI
jgi:amino acid transporter